MGQSRTVSCRRFDHRSKPGFRGLETQRSLPSLPDQQLLKPGPLRKYVFSLRFTAIHNPCARGTSVLSGFK